MTGVVLAVLSAALAAGLLVPAQADRSRPPSPVPLPIDDDGGPLRRHRKLCSVLAGVGAATFVGGPAGVVGAVAAMVAVWVVIGRTESPATRRRREDVRRDLPAVVTLVAAALRSGAATDEAVVRATEALPGAAADRLGPVAARLRLGVPATTVWSALVDDPELAPLGRTMARAHETGAPIVAAVERLAADLAQAARSEVEDRARAIGVKAAVPLGLCLLPAFVLIGIVPLAAALLESVVW